MHMDIISLEIMHDVHNLCGINQYEFHCKKRIFLESVYTNVYVYIEIFLINLYQYGNTPK